MTLSNKLFTVIVIIVIGLFTLIAYTGSQDAKASKALYIKCIATNGKYVQDYGSSVYYCAKVEYIKL